jgi:hypothetical protein
MYILLYITDIIDGSNNNDRQTIDNHLYDPRENGENDIVANEEGGRFG